MTVEPVHRVSADSGMFGKAIFYLRLETIIREDGRESDKWLKPQESVP